MHSSATQAPVRQQHPETYQKYLPAFVSVIAALLYAATLRFDFVYDDFLQIVSNPLIRSWKNLPLLFRTDVWGFWNPLVVGNYWRPVFMLSLLLNHSLFGLSPIGWHAAAVITHIVATYFVFKLVQELSDDSVLSTFAALIFAAHPSHLETVAWISGTTDSLMADFLLPSLLCFIRGWRETTAKKWAWYAGASLLYFCALLVKETAVVLPVFALAYILIFGSGRQKPAKPISAVLALLSLAVVSAIYLVLRRAVLHGVSHPQIHMSVGQLLVTIPSLLWFYMKHMAWPIGLGVYYDMPPVTSVSWSSFVAPLLCLLIVAAAYLWWVIRSGNRLAMFAGVLLLVPIIPVLYIPGLPVDDFVHDRYLYLSSIGFALIVALLLRQVTWGSRKMFGEPASQITLGTVVVLALCAATSAQQIYWANDLLLFSRAVQIAPGSANAYNNLGTALTTRGRMKEARFAYEQVLKRNPRSWIAQYNVGLGYFLDGNYPEAEAYLSKAVQLAPLEGDPAAALAESQIRQGRFAAGESSIRHAIAVKPYKPGYRRVLAMALAGQGKTAEAIEVAEAELTANPNDQETKGLLSRIRQHQN